MTTFILNNQIKLYNAKQGIVCKVLRKYIYILLNNIKITPTCLQ